MTTPPPPPPPPGAPPIPPPPAQAPVAPHDGVALQAAAVADRLLDEIEQAVVGKRAQLRLVLAGLLAGGHVLLDDVPGVAKTLAARSLATAAGLEFARVQFTPDVMPSDITGHTALDMRTNEPQFRAGPVFAQLVLADEINRAPAKTQAALLEAMQEGRVTIDGTTHALPSPFLVIATQNPVESEGTYPLPEAQLDRFILRTSIGYPEPAHEIEMLQRRIRRATDEPTIRPILDGAQFARLQHTVERVEVHPAIVDYVVAIVQSSRRSRDLALGSSPRGSLALLKVGRALALLNGRDFVTPDDIRAVALPTLAHRVVLTDEAWARGTPADAVVRAVVDSIPAPTWQ
jgi:MoxR-like ATPase